MTTTITPSDLETGTETEKLASKDNVSSSELIDNETKNMEPPEEISKEEWQDVLGSGGIMKKILREGQPDTKPQRLQKCVLNYCCMLEDETVVDIVDNFEINLGECDVVQGLDVAISLMNVKEKCSLKIESRLAFGAKGLLPKILPNTTVVFELELISVGPEDDIETLTIPQRKAMGNKKRERGNWWYIRGENHQAIQCYRRALDYLDEVEGGIKIPTESEQVEVTDSDLQDLLENRISVCNNMAAAQIKMELYDAALMSLQTVLRCQPNNVKALFRKAKVYKGKNDVNAAMKCLQKANELSPNDVDIQKQMNLLSQLIQKQKLTERELARRMFNGPKNSLTENSKKTRNKPAGMLRLWATIGATIAVGVAGVLAYRFKYA